MMNKLLILAVAICSVLSVSAQSETKPKEEYLSSANENWFLSVGGGAEYHLFNYPKNSSFDVKNNARFNFSAGKWIDPYVAFRATYAYSTFNVESVYGKNKFIGYGETSAKGGIHSLGLDVMINLSNMIGGYREDRTYVIKPFAGLEANYTYSKSDPSDGVYEYFPLLGIDNEFNVSKSLSINLSIAAAVTNVNMYGESVHSPLVWPIRTSVGFTYYLGRGKSRIFRKAVSPDSYTAISSENKQLANNLKQSKDEVYSLSNDKEALIKEVRELQSLKNKTSVQESVNNEVVTTPIVVFFNIGKSVVLDKEVVRLKYIAEIMKKEPSTKFVIEGYADSTTGNSVLNNSLSVERAKSVCDILVNKYGVNRSQLEPVGMGETNKLFDQGEYNRTVIIKTK